MQRHPSVTKKPGNIIRPPTENDRSSFSLPTPSLGSITLSATSSLTPSTTATTPSISMPSLAPINSRSARLTSTSSATTPVSSTTQDATRKRKSVSQTTQPTELIDTSRSSVKELMRNRKHVGKPTKATAEKEEARKRGKTAATEAEESLPPSPQVSRRASPPPVAPVFAPQLRVVDGKIVLNEESMTISTSDPINSGDYDVVYESNNHVTSSSYTNRTAPKKWTEEETELFFKALRQCGTDFNMISKLFPTRTRKQIRYKFKREDKENPRRVSYALMHPLPLEAEHYATIAAAIQAEGGVIEEGENGSATQTESVSHTDNATIEENIENDDDDALAPIHGISANT